MKTSIRCWQRKTNVNINFHTPIMLKTNPLLKYGYFCVSSMYIKVMFNVQLCIKYECLVSSKFVLGIRLNAQFFVSVYRRVVESDIVWKVSCYILSFSRLPCVFTSTIHVTAHHIFSYHRMGNKLGWTGFTV